ncbi:MAG: COG4280 domain-containing protein [Mycobacteriales bacterium]|nr:MAG: hypothetical protein DLM56_11635 [Pseudonocardiales bacterium]
MTGWPLAAATFLACGVEAVEAATIVLAVGLTRGWSSAGRGVAAALIVLVAVVAVLGPAVSALPLGALRIVVGGLLLVFGLGWLRKAILRAAGYRALHDEDQIYRRETASALTASSRSAFAVPDVYGFTIAFKGVLLEGLEVVFIVLTFGTNAHHVGIASIAALAAIGVVVAVAIAVRGPLTRVPENTLKLLVGTMLTSFGTFWAGEGAGAHWPGADASLLWLTPAVLVVVLAAAGWLRAGRRSALATSR